MYQRLLTKKIIALSKKFPVVSIMGPRQSGKTTLAKQLFKNYPFISLEDQDNRDEAMQDPRGFLSRFKKGVILDEVQRVPELFSYIQTHVDEKNKSGQFIFTGSQNYLLHQNLSQTLAGRVAMVRLLPMSMSELSTSGYKFKNLETTLFNGFYPGLLNKNIDPADWYPSYIETYVERDVRQVVNISNLSLFQKFLRLCAGRVGQILNLSSLGNDCGITHTTARAWMSILEASYTVFLLQPYFENQSRRLIKSPKIYFYDSGLVCSLLKIKSAEQLEDHYLKGGIFESFVMSELIKSNFNQGRNPDLYFWRDKTGNEVDCYIPNHKVHQLIEIKSGKTVNKDFFKGIRFLQEYGDSKKYDSYVVYGGAREVTMDNIKIYPWNNFADKFE